MLVGLDLYSRPGRGLLARSPHMVMVSVITHLFNLLYETTLYCTALCSAALYTALHILEFYMMLRTLTSYCSMLCSTVMYCIALHCMALYGSPWKVLMYARPEIGKTHYFAWCMFKAAELNFPQSIIAQRLLKLITLWFFLWVTL